MGKSISTLIKFLQDVNVKSKYKDVPDYIDNRDEILAEIYQDMEEGDPLPDWLKYFEINGISRPDEMNNVLENMFLEFKISFTSNDVSEKQELAILISDEIKKAKNILLACKKEFSPLKDQDLNELIEIKIKYCDKVNDLLSIPSGNKISLNNGKNIDKENIVYFFRLKSEISSKKEAVIRSLHSHLKEQNFLDSSFPAFKCLFIDFNKNVPEKSPEPVVWKNGNYNTLSYLIKKISGRIIEPGKGGHSNYKAAINLFYNQIPGQFFKPFKQGHDKDPSLEIKTSIDNIIDSSMT